MGCGATRLRDVAPDSFVDIQHHICLWSTKVILSDKGRRVDLYHEKGRQRAEKAMEKLRFRIIYDNLRMITKPVEYQDIPGKSGIVESQVKVDGTYENESPLEQTWTFKRKEIITTARAETNISSGLKIGEEMQKHNFSLSLNKLPKQVAAHGNHGLEDNILLQGTNYNVWKRDIEWGVDFTVRVPPGATAYVESVVTKASYEAKFLLVTTLKGTVKVEITNTKNNRKMFLFGKIQDIMECFYNRPNQQVSRRRSKRNQIQNAESNFCDIEDISVETELAAIDDDGLENSASRPVRYGKNSVKMVTKGTVKFRYGIRSEAHARTTHDKKHAVAGHGEKNLQKEEGTGVDQLIDDYNRT